MFFFAMTDILGKTAKEDNSMAKEKTQRVKALIDGYMELRLQEKSHEEIAEIFGVSKKTVLYYLQEIADKNQVTRDELLYRIQKPYIRSKNSSKGKVSFEQALELANELQNTINIALQEELV